MTDTPETPETEVTENTVETPVERPRRTLSLGGSRGAAPVEEAAPEEPVAPVAEDDDHGVDTTAEEDDEDDDGEPIVPNGRITLQELNEKTPEDLVAFAEGLDIENAGNLRKQDLLFAILKTLADEEVEIIASGVLEILPDGFGFLRSPDANYLPGPACARATRCTAPCAARARASATSPCSRSIRSTSKIRRWSRLRSCSTT